MKKRISSAVLAAGIISAIFAGCSGQSSSSSAPAPSSKALAPSSSVSSEAATGSTQASSSTSDIGPLESLPTLKIAASDWAYVADKKGWFKEAFEDHGIKVELVQGTLGNEAQLIARNDLHFANRMLYPYLLYRSQGADLTAVQVSNHPEPKIASIIVLKDSPIKTFDDLKGKKVASWRAGCPYMVLYELAENKGWKEGTDWTYVNIPSSESKTALISKQVDAIAAHPLTDIAQMLIDGSAREIAYPAEDSVYINGGGVTVTFTSSKFAEKYPNITKTYLALQDKTEAWMLKNLDEAATIVQGVDRVPTNISKLSWDRMGSTWSSNLNLPKIETESQTMEDWLVAHKDIDSAKQVAATKLFAPQYFNK